MSEEKKEDNLENAVHEVERFVRLNDRERALGAVEHLKTFTTTGAVDPKPNVETLTEKCFKRMAEALEFIAQSKLESEHGKIPSTRKK